MAEPAASQSQPQPQQPNDMTSFTFGQHIIRAGHVFFKTRLSFALVNRMPIKPGHVVVCPLRKVDRFRDMTSEEVADVFNSVHVIAKALESYYGVTAISVGMQDGADAGQTVKHVHIHIVPRRKGDFKHNDEIYPLMEKNDHFAFDSSEAREKRSDEDMAEEATKLRKLFSDAYTKDL